MSFHFYSHNQQNAVNRQMKIISSIAHKIAQSLLPGVKYRDFRLKIFKKILELVSISDRSLFYLCLVIVFFGKKMWVVLVEVLTALHSPHTSEAKHSYTGGLCLCITSSDVSNSPCKGLE